MPDQQSFANTFSRLIVLNRLEPDNAEGLAQALAAVVASVATNPAQAEAGIQLSGMYDELSLKGRLIKRHVEQVQVAAGAPAEELAALARALADDAEPIPSTDAVRVQMVAFLDPAEARDAGLNAVDAEPVEPGAFFLEDIPDWEDRRVRDRSESGSQISLLLKAVREAAGRGAWMEALHAAQALIQLAPGVPDDDRRVFAIQVKRTMPPPVLHEFIHFALRLPEERRRAAEVLHWVGLEAAEVMIEAIKETDDATPLEFLHDTLARMPVAVPLLIPLLDHPRPHVVRHAAELLGRLGDPRAVAPLKERTDHADARVRDSVLQALAGFAGGAAVDPLRQALSHPSPHTRSSAGWAIARFGSGALAMPLLLALQQERDESTWRELLAALASLEAPEAGAALATVALEKKSLLGKRGFTAAQRQQAVAILGEAGTAVALQALERIAREGEGEVQMAAREALSAARAARATVNQ